MSFTSSYERTGRGSSRRTPILQMLETVNCSAERLRRYSFEEGDEAVEATLDAALALAQHVDPGPPPREERRRPPRRTAHPYGDLFPPEEGEVTPAAPPAGESDLLRFLIQHSRALADWQRDVLEVVRQEALYFLPQRRTKVLNEGWATYWHLRILRELDLSDAEYTDFARQHAAVCAPPRLGLNPYHLGLRLLEDVERRKGREHLFAVRELESDASLVRNHLTPELTEELDLYLYRLEGGEWRVAARDWERVRDALADHLTHHGVPLITVEDDDWRGAGQLYLRHHYGGLELDLPFAEKTLEYVARLWGRPACLETVADGRRLLLVAGKEGVERQEL